MRWCQRFFCFLLLLAPLGERADAQYEDPTRLIDTPTASVIPHGSYDMNLRLYAGGGVLSGVRVGLRDVMLFGFCFGGTRVLGTGEPDWNPRVEFRIKGLIWRESYLGPALALGYDSQGYGPYDAGTSRYQLKSRGFYAVASKHFVFLGDLGIHGGTNYSLERDDDDDDLNFFVGLEKSVNPALDLLAEYDIAVNDNSSNELFGEGKGYLSGAFLWRVSDNFHLELDFRNLLKNGEGSGDLAEWGDWSREIQITYVDFF